MRRTDTYQEPECVHSWTTHVYPERLLDSAGWPIGVYVANESRTCADCTEFAVRRVPGTYCDSPTKAMDLYRQQMRAEEAS